MSLGENIQHVYGNKKDDVMLYALSTCGWCRKTKGLLDEMGVEYNYIDVDFLQEAERKEALEEIKLHNPKCSFPTMIINNDRCIVGFKEDETREVLSVR